MFFNKVGKMALGSRLRMISELMTEDAVKLYELYKVGLKPKWFPVFYLLSEEGEKCITTLAQEINQSHPSVINIVREMVKNGLVVEKKDKTDRRKNIIALTAKGKSLVVKIKDQYIDVNQTIETLLTQTQHNIWYAMEELEFLLNEQSLYERVLAQKKQRESKDIRIVSYTPQYKTHFKTLNEAWITQYFKMEEADYSALEHPETYILNKGGYIFVALYKEQAVGVCALIAMEDADYDFELAKMAVSPEVQGKGIGQLLANAVIDKARSIGAKNIYLESNTVLKPAIRLYQKLGFKKVSRRDTPYERANIQMELSLRPTEK